MTGEGYRQCRNDEGVAECTEAVLRLWGVLSMPVRDP